MNFTFLGGLGKSYFVGWGGGIDHLESIFGVIFKTDYFLGVYQTSRYSFFFFFFFFFFLGGGGGGGGEAGGGGGEGRDIVRFGVELSGI